jgi:hypothetical protein
MGEGTAYLDDFEDRGEIVVPLQRNAWRSGSAPASLQRAEQVLPQTLTPQNAGVLVWQHDYLDPGGRTAGSLPLTAIDRRIRVSGSRLEPNVLYLTLHAAAQQRAWRSMTTVLSAAGRDLRNHEYLEVYVGGAGDADALVLDLGTVSEDAFTFDAQGRRGGIDAEGRPWGEGVLDREWDPGRESWTAAHDRGLWDPACRAEPRAVYPLGDPAAGCTRGNGLPDTEDLNGNGLLDTDERVFRYVVRPADPGSPYLAADTTETGTGFRLFRIPLDRAAGVGVLSDEIRQVRHLRVTVAGGSGTQLVLARMRLVGSRWEKRGPSGVVDGLVGNSRPGSALARVEVGPVGRLSAGAAYVSPPGVTDAPQDAAAALGAQGGTEFNEQALRVVYRGLEAGERAEVYRRYEGGPQNFLAYRQLRVWALARDGGWGAGGEALVVRVGTDPENHYLYRARLARTGAPATPADWGPELVIHFDRWLQLRAEAERRLAERRVSALDPLVVWDADSTHAVVISERGRAPNLAAVREISLGVWNGGIGPADGEVWINDLRLGAAERRPGVAATASLGMRRPGMVDAEVALTRRSGHFRELSSLPTYQDDDALSFRAAVQLDRLLPGAAGLDAPLVFNVERTGQAPVFVDGTDLAAGALPGLRQLGGARTRMHLTLRHRNASARPWMRATLDGLAFQMGIARTADETPFSSMRRAEATAGVSYQIRPAARSVEVLRPPSPRLARTSLATPPPRCAGPCSRERGQQTETGACAAAPVSRQGMTRHTDPGQRSARRDPPIPLTPFPPQGGQGGTVPARMANSSAHGQLPVLPSPPAGEGPGEGGPGGRAEPAGCAGTPPEQPEVPTRAPGLQLRWTPVQLSFGSAWSNASDRSQRFAGLLDAPAAGLATDPGAVRTLVNHASASVQPLQSLAASFQLRSTSDLLPSARLNPAAALRLEGERSRLGGIDLGRESQRDLATQWAWSPRLTSWLSTRATLSSNFALDANPALAGASGLLGDTALAPLRSFGNRRALGMRWGVDPQALARATGFGDGTAAAGWERGAALVLAALRRVEVGWGNSLESRYDRAAADPDFGYQLALGGRSAFGGLAPAGPSLLADRSHWTARGQLRLPGDIGMTLSFSDADGLQSGQRGERSERTREWPGVLAQWSGAPWSSLLGGLVRNASIAGGYTLQSRRMDDRASGQLRSSRSSRIPFDIAVQWTNGFTTAYRGEWRLGAAVGPTASTEQVSADHSVSVGGAFHAPAALAPVLAAPIAVSLRYAHADQRECRLSFELSHCLPGAAFSGMRNRIWSAQLDTQASGMTFGLQLEHRDRASRTGSLSGHRQFSLNLFGQFNLNAGTIP